MTHSSQPPQVGDDFKSLSEGAALTAPRAIFLVDCDGTFFNFNGQPVNKPLLDFLVQASQAGCRVIFNSAVPTENDKKVRAVFDRESEAINNLIFGEAKTRIACVIDKVISKGIVKHIDPEKRAKIVIIDDDALYSDMTQELFHLMGREALAALPDEFEKIKSFIYEESQVLKNDSDIATSPPLLK